MTQTDPDIAYSDLVTRLARGAEIDVQVMLTVLAAAGKSMLELEHDVIAADHAAGGVEVPSTGGGEH